MAGYQPLKISGNATGLVQEREQFLLPDDAYPVLQNAYVWREQLKRKLGCQLLGRLQRNFTATSIGNSGVSPWTFNLFAIVTPPITETNKELILKSVSINIGGTILIDQGDGTLATNPISGVSGTINYITGDITITGAGAGIASTATFSYSPGLPVMGIRIRERQNSGNDQTIFFDTVYAYMFNGALRIFQEFIPGTIWTGSNSNFFWTTNYWVTPAPANIKLLWVTNDTTVSPGTDPIRYTNGVSWVNFSPIINAAGDLLINCAVMLPFRGRLVVFNTSEGQPGQGALYTNRIRWAAIGNPISDTSVLFPLITQTSPTAWRDDIRGKGGFLDIPTSEDIISVGFVRDNVVIYCENSTWQLRYTGRSIAPFQIERVNSELGALSAFSSIQFDTSLVTIGDKGIVECDSYKSELIDVKIPDLVFNFQNLNNGPQRIQGIRDFENRLAYWTFVGAPLTSTTNGVYPNQRLVYNYENDSWGLFDDSYTAFGTFQEPSGRNWVNTHLPWIKCHFPWISQATLQPAILGGNQQGFIEQLDQTTSNDISLSITSITANTTNPTVVTSPSHNMNTGTIIEIYDIPTGTEFDNLNFTYSSPFNNVFEVVFLTNDTFQLWKYNPVDDKFSTPQLDVPTTGYVGGGKIAIRDNFFIQSKKFNFMDEGQSIQMGYLDILMESVAASPESAPGAISLNVYLDYNVTEASNTLPQNEINDGLNQNPDTFFNTIIPTVESNLNDKGGTKFWQRVYCATRANFLTLEYTFSNAQMAGTEQNTQVQIDSQVLWIRRGGRMTQI